MSADVEIVLRAGALNGETPIWCAQRRKLFWIDLRQPALHAFDPATRQDQAWEMPAWIGCYGLTEAGALVALRSGLFRFDFATGALGAVAPAPFDARRFTFNDGRCDPQGRFLVGTMYSPLPPGDQRSDVPQRTPVFRYAGRQKWESLAAEARISNGLAFSPDGRRMYHADTPTRTIWRWDYDAATGALANRRVFAELDGIPDGAGPDGANVDRDGFYWCAVYGAGVLHRYDPDGRLERQVRMPVRCPTMPAFGGADRATLFVTSANWQMSAQQRQLHPDEGALMALPAPVPGVPEPFVDPSQLGGG